MTGPYDPYDVDMNYDEDGNPEYFRSVEELEDFLERNSDDYEETRCQEELDAELYGSSFDPDETDEEYYMHNDA